MTVPTSDDILRPALMLLAYDNEGSAGDHQTFGSVLDEPTPPREWSSLLCASMSGSGYLRSGRPQSDVAFLPETGIGTTPSQDASSSTSREPPGSDPRG